MAVLAVAATLGDLLPTPFLQHADDGSHLHSSDGNEGVCLDVGSQSSRWVIRSYVTGVRQTLSTSLA
jgi:hypothetical protein